MIPKKDQTTLLKATKSFVFVLQLAHLGVTEDFAGTTPHAELLGPEQKKEWVAHRAFVALFVASHRGHVETAKFLLRHGNILRQNNSYLAVTAQHTTFLLTQTVEFYPNGLSYFVFEAENVFSPSVLM